MAGMRLMRHQHLHNMLIVFFVMVSVVEAAMTKHIEAVSPRIGQRGTTVEVTLFGVSIHQPREVIFFGSGIRAYDIKTADKPPQSRGLAHGGRISEAVVCKFEIAPDCKPGEHPFRLLTATELTCIGTFHVSPFPVVDENEVNSNTNDTKKTALELVPNVTVRGVMSGWSQGDVDLFRVAGRAGELLSVEVDSARLADTHYGASEFDLAVRILDETGRVLGANDDNPVHIQDPMVSVILPTDGHVYVEVSRSVFISRDTVYCVHMGKHRRPLVAFPAGGLCGTTQTFQLLGDPSGPFEVQRRLSQEEGWMDEFGEAPSSLRLRCSPLPNLLEASDLSETRLTSLPIALNGILDRRDDIDVYRLQGRKDQRMHIRVFSAALGSPLDPQIRIRPLGTDGQPGPAEVEADDARLDQRDIFGTSYRGGGGQQEILDPSLIWEPQTDGEYLLEISDNGGAGGPTGVYRIEIQPPRTVVQTLLASRTFDWTESMRVSGMIVPQGNRWTVNLSFPQGQWTPLPCDFELVARGLPKGVTMTSPRIKPGTTVWPLQFAAEPDTELGGAVITLEARPSDPAVQVETRNQQNVPFINHPGGDAWRAVQVQKYIVGVTEPAPFSIDIEPPKVALVRGGELAIPVQVTRHRGFSGPVECSVGFADGAIDLPPPIVIPADKSEGLLLLSAQTSAPLGVSPLVVIGSTVNESVDPFLGAGQVRVSSPIVEISVSEPYLELASQPDSIRRGEQKLFVWTIQHKTPFEGAARVRLLGLPKGVTVVEPNPVVTKESKQIAFELRATDEALLGQVTGLTCEVIVPVADQQITQRTGRGRLRIDPGL